MATRAPEHCRGAIRRPVTAGPVDELRDQRDADTTVSIQVSFAPGELLANLPSMDVVSSVTATKSELTVTCTAVRRSCGWLSTVSKVAVGYDDFTTREPSLEDVFSAATDGEVA